MKGSCLHVCKLAVSSCFQNLEDYFDYYLQMSASVSAWLCTGHQCPPAEVNIEHALGSLFWWLWGALIS